MSSATATLSGATSLSAMPRMQSNAAPAEARAISQAASEAVREQVQAQAQAQREQTQQMREQAQQMREQAQEFKENLKAQIESEIAAARAAQGGEIPVPPVPPVPPIVFSTGRGVPFNGDVPPGAVEVVSIVGLTLVCCVVGFPIARAFARWLDRRGTPSAVTPEMSNRLHAIEQAVESIAVEVERISEGQRFTTRVLSERAPDAVADFRAREPIHVGLPADSGPGAPVNARRS